MQEAVGPRETSVEDPDKRMVMQTPVAFPTYWAESARNRHNYLENREKPFSYLKWKPGTVDKLMVEVQRHNIPKLLMPGSTIKQT